MENNFIIPDYNKEKEWCGTDGRLLLNDEVLKILSAFGALYWSTGDIADWFGVTDFSWWLTETNNPHSKISRAIKYGELQNRAKIELGILQGAMNGSSEEIETYRNMMRDKSFALNKTDLFGGADDPKLWHKIEEYIVSGSKGSLSDKERRYLDLLNIVYSLDGKFGKKKVIKYLTSDLFGYSYSQAANIYSEAIELYHCNRKISKAALREKTADMYENLYMAAVAAAKTTADYTLAAEILNKRSKLLRLDQDDPQKLNPGTYERKPVVLSLNPEHIGLEKADRRKLAEIIDKLPVPDTEKVRLESEAGIRDMDIIKVMEYESQEASQHR